MNDIELIKAEIERMHQEAVLAACGNHTDWLLSRIGTCVDILAFIDSLPKEFPPYCTGFKGDPDPPGISYLEEAAEEYAIPFNDTTYGCEYSYRGFIA